MSVTNRKLLLFAAALVAAATTGCAGGTRRGPPLMPGVTTLGAPLPSHRCAPGKLTCVCLERGADADAAKETSPPPAGTYRFELAVYNMLRTEAELVVGGLGHLLRPTGESLKPDCWYVDLAPGFHPVRYRIAPTDGADVTIGLRIRRYAEVAGEAGAAPEPTWYEVLDLECGEGRAAECDRETLRKWIDRYRARPGRVTDPCGNATLRKLAWDALLAPMGDSLDEAEVSFELVVMNPPPDKKPCLER